MQLSVDGRAVHVHTGGQPFDPAKPVLVLVHGAGNDHTVWSLQARWFAHHGHAVLVPDLPGHGRSEGPALTSVDDLAAWLLRLLDVAGAGRAVLAGHSMGALVALAAAAAAPDRTAGLVLVGPSDRMRVHPDLLAAAAANDPVAFALITDWGFARAAQRGGGQTPGMWMTGGGRALLAACPPDVLGVDLAACDAWEGAPAAAAAVACPTLFVLGAQDRMTPVGASKAIRAAIAGARTEILPATGHMIMAERPNETIDAMARFLGDAE